MRVSTSWSHQLSVNAMLDQYAKLNESQLKLSSGKKYLTPSENAVAATKQIDLQQNIEENRQYQVNIGSARQRLDLEESSLANATDVLQRIRELAVQGLNGINNQANRQQIALEIDQLNEHLMGIANTQNANGEYLFSGYATDTKAFTGGPYAYQGDNNQRRIAIGPDRQIADGDSGEAVFGAISGSTTPGSIGNVFEAVGQLSADLKADKPSPNSLADLDQALERFVTVRASAGARLRALDDQEKLNDDYILDNQATASEIGDLDYAEAMSKFNQQQLSLQAAQQAYAKVQDLSLFNYL